MASFNVYLTQIEPFVLLFARVVFWYSIVSFFCFINFVLSNLHFNISNSKYTALEGARKFFKTSLVC